MFFTLRPVYYYSLSNNKTLPLIGEGFVFSYKSLVDIDSIPHFKPILIRRSGPDL